MNLTFVELLVFSARWNARRGDEQLRALQSLLLSDPDRGDPIPGCGMLRKLRFGDESRGRGKRGGLRVIYMHTPDLHRIDLITVYGKDEADDLTKDQIAELCALARLLRQHARAATKSKERRHEKGR